MDGEAQRHTGGQTLTGYDPKYWTVCFRAASEAGHTRPPLLFRHNGPVWQVAWAHPKFGHILASCSYDGRVLIWKEQSSQQASTPAAWTRIKEHTLHTASGTDLPGIRGATPV